MESLLEPPFQLHLRVCSTPLYASGSMSLQEKVVADYGPYTPPNRARALRHYYHECSHHFMFSFWRTKISDLTEFGSHMLYLSLLWYLSIAFAALLAVLGVPLIVSYAHKGDFFANGMLRKASLGNYGPIYVEGAMRAAGTPPVVCPVAHIRDRLSFRP